MSVKSASARDAITSAIGMLFATDQQLSEMTIERQAAFNFQYNSRSSQDGDRRHEDENEDKYDHSYPSDSELH